jgi:hypothetical protein
MEFTVDLHLDLGPALVEELVPVGESDADPVPTTTVVPRSCLH